MTDYSNQPYPAPAAPPNSTLALASLILGILGWTIIPGIGSIAAVITGHMAKSEIRRSMGALGGDGMATAGLVLGYIQVGLSVLCACIWLAMVALGMTLPFLEGSF